MRVNYEGHDRAYQKLRQESAMGWDKSEKTYLERFEILETQFAHSAVPPNGRVIELGCGAGNIAFWLHERGYQVTGLDISKTAIDWACERAAQRHVSIDFHHCGVLNMQAWSPGLFDIAYDSHCLHCIIGNDRSLMLRETKRLLKQGGLFLIDTMCGPVNHGALEGYDPETGLIWHGDLVTRYIGEPDVILNEIQAAGFKIITETRYQSHGHQNLFVITQTID